MRGLAVLELLVLEGELGYLPPFPPRLSPLKPLPFPPRRYTEWQLGARDYPSLRGYDDW